MFLTYLNGYSKIILGIFDTALRLAVVSFDGYLDNF